MPPKDAKSRVPALFVEQLALGELSPERAREIEARLAAEPGGLERLARMRQENEAFPSSHPAREVVAQLRRRAGRPSSRSLWLAALPALAAAAVVTLWLRPSTNTLRVDPAALGGGATRLKGAEELSIHRQVAGGVEQIQPDAKVRAGDVLQLAYFADAARRPYGVILSIDGRGGVTLHFPERVGESEALAPGGETALPRAYQLDDAPAFERFFFITSPKPIDLSRVLAQAHALARDPQVAAHEDLDLPPDLHQSSLTLRKEN